MTAALMEVTGLCDPGHLAGALGVLFGPGLVTEIRAFKAQLQPHAHWRPEIYSGYFDNGEDLVNAARGFVQAEAVYFVLNPVKPALLSRACNHMKRSDGKLATTADHQTLKRRWVLVDIDAARLAGISSTEAEHETARLRALQIQEWLTGQGWPAPLVADSGNGAHLLYRIDLPNDDSATALVQACLKALAAKFDDPAEAIERAKTGDELDPPPCAVDTSVYNASRLCKLYGTRACKGDHTHDRPHRMSALVDVPDEIQVAGLELLERLAAMAPKEKAAPPPKQRAASRAGPQSFDLDSWITKHLGGLVGEPKAWKGSGRRWTFRTCPFNVEHTGRKAWLAQMPGGAIAAGCQHDSCDWGWRELRARFEPDRATPDGGLQRGAGLPAIHLHTKEHAVATAAIAAIAANDGSGLYHRQISLVKVVRAQREPKPKQRAVHRREGTPLILPATAPNIREALTASADLQKFDRRSKGWVDAHPPDWLVSMIAARGEWHGIRFLEAVVETPVLRPDGTVLARPGYDEATGLLFAPSEHFKAIPKAPSHNDAVQAKDELLEVIGDFPFESEAHKAVWLAAALTPFAFFGYRGPTPLFLFNANTRGSGKTLLAHAALSIAFRRPPAVCPNAVDDEEWQKRIFAFALAGDRAVLVDNVVGLLGCASLDAALTSPDRSVTGRILGKSETRSAPLNVIWYVTGNNVQMSGDLIRRIAHCRIRTELEHPERRDPAKFAHPDLLGWIGKNRPRLVKAALTVLRAYCVAGRPQSKLAGAWGLFDGWADLVRQAVVWVGMPDPAKTVLALEDTADIERNRLRDLLRAIYKLDPDGHGWTVPALLKDAARTKRVEDEDEPKHPELHAALAEFGGRKGGLPTTRSLGNILRTRRDRIVGGLRLDQRPEKDHQRAVWVVREAVPGAGSLTSLGSLTTPRESKSVYNNIEYSGAGRAADTPASLDSPGKILHLWPPE